MTVKTVYLGRDNPTVVTFYKSGEVIDFSVMNRYIVKFRENDLIVDTDELAFSGLISGTNQGVVSFNFGELNIEAGTYTLEFTAYDPLHDDGQIIVDYDHDLKFKFIEDFDFELVVQDDEGTETDANTYIDLTYFKSYHRKRGNDYHNYDDFQIKTALVRAIDYLDSRFEFVSQEKNTTQNTKWPRIGFDIIPRVIKEAQAEYAFRALSANLNPDPQNISNGRLIKSKTEQLTPISETVTYEDSSGVYMMPDYPAADEKIKKAGLVQSGNVLFLMRG